MEFILKKVDINNLTWQWMNTGWGSSLMIAAISYADSAVREDTTYLAVIPYPCAIVIS
jgi:hypothetical protein